MRYLLILIVLFFNSCAKKTQQFTAHEIINQSIKVANFNKVSNAKISFDFRGVSYTATRNNGFYTLTKQKDSLLDILTNKNFTRKIDNKTQLLSDSLTNIYKNSLNSVHYFSVLPFGLNDKAVQKKKLADEIINGKDYYKVQVTFSENGGGDDFEDVFVYWFLKENFQLDYLAYEYHTNGGGIRFRAVNKENLVKEIRFTNYDNYKPKNNRIILKNTGKAFENGQLEKISEINLENITVNLNDF